MPDSGSTGYWNTLNYAYNNRICLLGCGHRIDGRIPVVIGNEVGLD